MEAIIVALIGVAGNLGGILLSYRLSKKDTTSKTERASVSITREDITKINSSIISRSAKLSFISGIVGLFTAGIFSIVAIVAGHRAKRDIQALKNNLQGLWLANAGLVLGYLGVAYFFIVFAFIVKW